MTRCMCYFEFVSPQGAAGVLEMVVLSVCQQLERYNSIYDEGGGSGVDRRSIAVGGLVTACACGSCACLLILYAHPNVREYLAGNDFMVLTLGITCLGLTCSKLLISRSGQVEDVHWGNWFAATVIIYVVAVPLCQTALTSAFCKRLPSSESPGHYLGAFTAVGCGAKICAQWLCSLNGKIFINTLHFNSAIIAVIAIVNVALVLLLRRLRYWATDAIAY